MTLAWAAPSKIRYLLILSLLWFWLLSIRSSNDTERWKRWNLKRWTLDRRDLPSLLFYFPFLSSPPLHCSSLLSLHQILSPPPLTSPLLVSPPPPPVLPFLEEVTWSLKWLKYFKRHIFIWIIWINIQIIPCGLGLEISSTTNNSKYWIMHFINLVPSGYQYANSVISPTFIETVLRSSTI